MFFRVVGRLTVRFLKGLGKALIWPFRAIGKRPVVGIFSLLVIAGIVAAGIFTNGFGVTNLFTSNPSSKLVTTPNSQVPFSQGSATVLTALAEFDAKKIWESLNPDYRKQFESEGYSQEAMQKAINDTLASLDPEKGKPTYNGFELYQRPTNIARTGGKVEVFIGTASYKDAIRQYLYQVQLDKDGKVSGLSNPEGETDPILAAAFKKAKTKEDNTPQVGQASKRQTAAAEQLMAGLTTLDPEKVWNTLSPDYQKTLSSQAQKVDLNSMKKAVQSFKSDLQKLSANSGYVGYVFQGTYDYPSGTAYTQYVGTLQLKDEVRDVSYGFLMDKSGRITAITTNDPILNGLLGRQQQQ